MTYQIYPLKAGDNRELVDKSMLVYRYPSGTGVQLVNGSFALKGDDGWILVDAGTASEAEIAAMGKEVLDNYMPFLELLKRYEIDPLEVRHVILTHLHWDHVWNLDQLPNASVYVQKKELEHAVNPYIHERKSFGFTGVKGLERPRWLCALDRMVVVDGETDILPGIQVILTPGHTKGSQSVLVDTTEGTYALTGDFLFCMKENWEEGRQVGLFTSCDDWNSGYRNLKAKKLAGIIPTHLPESYERIYG